MSTFNGFHQFSMFLHFAHVFAALLNKKNGLICVLWAQSGTPARPSRSGPKFPRFPGLRSGQFGAVSCQVALSLLPTPATNRSRKPGPGTGSIEQPTVTISASHNEHKQTQTNPRASRKAFGGQHPPKPGGVGGGSPPGMSLLQGIWGQHPGPYGAAQT